jgi:hypothetical protein
MHMLDALSDLVFEGHALVSADGMIADENSRMPASLRHDADWAQYQAALARAAIVASGRKGHEAFPNPKRRRLVLTRGVARTEQQGNATLWNPAGIGLAEVLADLGITSGTVAVSGVFDFFLPYYDRFVLDELHGLVLPGGTPCFTAGHPRTVLAAAGLRPSAAEQLDQGLTLTTWTRE